MFNIMTVDLITYSSSALLYLLELANSFKVYGMVDLI